MRRMISVDLLRAELGESKSVADVVFDTVAHVARNSDANFGHIAEEINRLEVRLSELRKCAPSYTPLFHVRRDDDGLISEVWVEYLPAPGGAAQ